jgi:UDP-2-acetamido-2,6-beta-L-arabino-hexul-4-ose reductase
MNVLVTGAKGFIGRNLVVALHRIENIDVQEFDLDSAPGMLEEELASAEVVFHLAGVNRPQKMDEFLRGNVDLTKLICRELAHMGRKPLVVFSSSTQATLDNPYGLSKRQAEEVILGYGAESGSDVVIFRLPGVFGKWSLPNYNSVVATFCYNIARGIPIQLIDSSREIELVYVDDVIAGFVNLLKDRPRAEVFADVAPVYRVTVGVLAKNLYQFKEKRANLQIADLADPFLRKLFGTYVSYLPPDQFAYDLERKSDPRGTLAEVIKTDGHGQFFISRTKPGVTRGNHYHDTKVEKFLVLEGDAIIRFRNLYTGEKVEYPVNGEQLKVVDIPPGWTHSIQNIGTSEMIVLFWSSEVFDPSRPDTYPMEV